MRISAFDLFRFELPLRHPLVLRGHHLTKRAGLIIRLEDQDNRVSLGEVSPLPGFSREEMILVEDQLGRLREFVLGGELPGDLDGLSGGFEEWLGDLDLAPSVRFGFEAAVLGLSAAARRVPLCRLITDAPLNSISVNGLLVGPLDAVMKKAERLLEAGYKAFKLKVGQRSVEEDVAMVRALRKQIPEGVALRLDANRAWEMDEAVSFADALADVKVDYVEEPVKSLALLRRFAEVSGHSMPIALDESLVELTPEQLSFPERIQAVVLKPTLLGFEKAIRFARSATARGITPVVSAAFESGVGLGILAQMAVSINRNDVPAGLDTLDWLEEDLLETPMEINKGRLAVSALPHAAEALKGHLLRVIDHG